MSIPYYQDVAKAYILYRKQKNDLRYITKAKINNKYKYLDYDFLKAYINKDDPFPNQLGKVVFYRTYSRAIPEEGRRERWWETVARVVEYSSDLEVIATKRELGSISDKHLRQIKDDAREIFDLMWNLKLFPSGRTLFVGGTKSAYENPISNFNCSFVTIDKLDNFAEMFQVLMLGTGVGLSVESKYIARLPKINAGINIIHKDYDPVNSAARSEHTQLRELNHNTMEIIIGDSRYGWSTAIKYYFDIISQKNYSKIQTIILNYNNIRPAGEPLKTFGGTASGHIAIKTMFGKICNMIKDEQKRQQNNIWIKLRSINALDIATIIAENVVSGGVRRSALIVFCDKSDKEVQQAKTELYQQVGDKFLINEALLHRQLANITVLRYEEPSENELSEQFDLMRYSGEPAFGNMSEMLRRRPDAQGGNPLPIQS